VLIGLVINETPPAEMDEIREAIIPCFGPPSTMARIMETAILVDLALVLLFPWISEACSPN
jgi:hypothetical protein